MGAEKKKTLAFITTDRRDADGFENAMKQNVARQANKTNGTVKNSEWRRLGVVGYDKVNHENNWEKNMYE